jgi:hypothetical protein
MNLEKTSFLFLFPLEFKIFSKSFQNFFNYFPKIVKKLIFSTSKNKKDEIECLSQRTVFQK